MKTFAFFIALLLFSKLTQAQKLTTTIDRSTGDSVISTGFDTLKAAGKKEIADRVVGVRSSHKGKSTYWLFFYFSTSDISRNTVNISNKNFAYFVLNNGTYLRFPYKGRTNQFAPNDNAGFFIDITKSLDRLRSVNVTAVRLETSTFYHEITIPEKNQAKIAGIVNRLAK